jgi:uncharacterized protein YcnI
MRCSGWSLRSTWACSALAVALLAAPVAAGAPARPSIDPSTVTVGGQVDLLVAVPNADDRIGVDHVTIGIPQDFLLGDAEAKTGWRQSRTGQAVTWWGGAIPVGEFARFGVRGRAPANPETVLLNVVVGDRNGKSATYRVPLEVVDAATGRDSARSLAKAALIVGVVGIALALGAGIAALALWLKRPPV